MFYLFGEERKFGRFQVGAYQTFEEAREAARDYKGTQILTESGGSWLESDCNCGKGGCSCVLEED